MYVKLRRNILVLYYMYCIKTELSHIAKCQAIKFASSGKILIFVRRTTKPDSDYGRVKRQIRAFRLGDQAIAAAEGELRRVGGVSLRVPRRADQGGGGFGKRK